MIQSLESKTDQIGDKEPERWKKEIEKYSQECEPFKRELEFSISDIDNSYSKTYYAVDFSEIYAFLFPDRTAKEFRLFSDEAISTLAVLQRQALDRLFFGKQKIVLLPPYAIEWNSALVHIRNREFEELSNLGSKASAEIQKLSQNSNIKSLLNKKYSEDKSLSADECQWLLEFLQGRNSILLEIFLERRHFNFQQRLEKLAAGDRFTDLKDLLGEEYPFKLNYAEIDDYYHKLIADRRYESDGEKTSTPASCRLDAIAFFMLEKANQILQPKNVRLLLVTRSKVMHKVMDEQRGRDESLLRHPRKFIDFFSGGQEQGQVEQGKELELKQRLLQHKSTVDAFSQSVEAFFNQDSVTFIEPKKASNTQPDVQKILKEAILHFSKIKETWNHWIAYNAVSNVPSEETNFEIKAFHRTGERTAYRILNLFRDDQHLRQHLQKRVEHLANDWNQAHQSLGVVLQGSVTKNPIELAPVTDIEQDKHELQTRSRNHFYYVHVYSNEAKRILEQADNGINWLELIASFSEQKSLSLSAKYEQLLVMAFILGTFNKWDLAELYCDLALDVSKEDLNISKGEAYYFKAVCMRKLKRTADTHREAIEILQKAIEQREKYDARKRKKRKSKDSARYLQEYGLQILMLNILLYKGEKSVKDDLEPALGLQKLEEAEEILNKLLNKGKKADYKNSKLRIKINNDRLYYYVQTNQLTNKANIKKYCDRLEKLQKDLMPERKNWPPLILDTITWVRWQLGELSKSDDVWKKSVEIMEQALINNPELVEKEKAEIRGHLAAMRSL